MRTYVGLDVSMEETAVGIVDEDGRILAERKVATLPEAIASFLVERAGSVDRVGLETGPLAVWLWNELRALGVAAICIDARHAKAGLLMMINNTDRNDAVGNLHLSEHFQRRHMSDSRARCVPRFAQGVDDDEIDAPARQGRSRWQIRPGLSPRRGWWSSMFALLLSCLACIGGFRDL